MRARAQAKTTLKIGVLNDMSGNYLDVSGPTSVACTRQALEDFVALPPSPLEQRERLEQLRALEAGLRIDVRLVDTVPFGVDTPHDLARATALMSLAA